MTRKPRRQPKKKKPQKKPQLAFAVILAEGRHPLKSQDSDKSEQQTDSSDEDGDFEARKQCKLIENTM